MSCAPPPSPLSEICPLGLGLPATAADRISHCTPLLGKKLFLSCF